MILSNDYVKEETILEPYKTEFRTEGFIRDVDYLYSPNRYGEFSVSWIPLTDAHGQQLDEQLQGYVSQVQLSISPYSRKVATPQYENNKGEFFSSQLYAPKVNIEVPHPTELIGKTATFVGHVRDLPMGQIVLQLGYLDVDDINNGIQEEDASAPVVQIFDDW